MICNLQIKFIEFHSTSSYICKKFVGIGYKIMQSWIVLSSTRFNKMKYIKNMLLVSLELVVISPNKSRFPSSLIIFEFIIVYEIIITVHYISKSSPIYSLIKLFQHLVLTYKRRFSIAAFLAPLASPKQIELNISHTI